MRRFGRFSKVARGRTLLAALCVSALVFAACGGDDDDDDGGETTETTAPADDGGDDTGGELTDSFRGVTAGAIKLGIVLVDYSAIADFVDFERGDQERTFQVLIDWINSEGGVGGRMIEPVFLEYPPIPGMEPSPLAICTQLTEDEEVFAILGVFIDFTGDGQLCVSRDHDTIHIGHELQQAWIDEADPGLLLTPGGVPEGTVERLLLLLDQEGTLEGRTVAVLGDDDAESRINDVIVPGLEELGVDMGSTGILTITGTDTAAAQGQLDGIIERWKEEGVDTIFMAGLTASAKQFVEKIGAEIPDVLFIVDSGSVAQQAQDLEAAGTTPNPYVGMLTVEGQSRFDRWDAPNETLQACVDAYEEATGETVLPPEEAEVSPEGKTIEIYVAVEDACDELLMFKQIAEKAGANLTNDTWVEAVHSFGPIAIATSNIASLCEGKYTANDEYGLVEFDPSIGENGDWAPVTELVDTSEGRCG